ncbi:hypothetical protein BG015_002602, partial [Linnemannia schmuckeri]
MFLKELKTLMEYLDKESVVEINANDCYPTFREPLADCYMRLTNWFKYIEDPANYGRPLQSEDYMFSCLDKEGRVKLDEPWSSGRVLSLLPKYIEEAGLLTNKPKGKFSTYCFRRGGAQHWCMFAEDRWSLKPIKWWGEWRMVGGLPGKNDHATAELLTQHSMAQALPWLSPDQSQGSLSSETLGQQRMNQQVLAQQQYMCN